MKKTTLVIIDNGQAYSSHRHWVACSCPNKEEAEKLVDSFTLWFTKAKLAYDENDLDQFMVENKPPIWNATSEEFDIIYSDPSHYTAAIIEVPEWAEGLK